MRLPIAIGAFCLAVTAESPASACRFTPRPPSNAPHEELYRDTDTALVLATVINGGQPSEAALRLDDMIYGQAESAPLMLGWAGDPQYSYEYRSGYEEGEDGTVIVGGCGSYEPIMPDVITGQRVMARLGVALDGAQVVVRWWPLDVARQDPRIAAYLAARRPAYRRRLGAQLRPYGPWGVVVIKQVGGRP